MASAFMHKSCLIRLTIGPTASELDSRSHLDLQLTQQGLDRTSGVEYAFTCCIDHYKPPQIASTCNDGLDVGLLEALLFSQASAAGGERAGERDGRWHTRCSVRG